MTVVKGFYNGALCKTERALLNLFIYFHTHIVNMYISLIIIYTVYKYSNRGFNVDSTNFISQLRNILFIYLFIFNIFIQGSIFSHRLFLNMALKTYKY